MTFRAAGSRILWLAQRAGGTDSGRVPEGVGDARVQDRNPRGMAGGP
jgi:hypothetical protein